MADDLNSFFGSSKKKGGKKKKVQDINIIEKKLAKAVRESAVEVEAEEERERQRTETEFLRPKNEEDEEWHDYVEQDEFSVKIKEMVIDPNEEPEPEEDEDADDTEDKDKKKSWNVGGEEVEEEEPPPPKPEEPAQPKTYRAPAARRAGWNSGRPEVAPDIGSDSLFPSLDVADTIAKEQEEDKKKQEFSKAAKTAVGTFDKANKWEVVGEKNAAAADENSAGKYRPPGSRLATGAPPSRPAAVTEAMNAAAAASPAPVKQPEPVAQTPNRYVPPSLRGAAATPVENRFSNLQS